MEISFKDLGLDENILKAVEAKGFKEPMPIQILAIPRLLNGEANVIAKARTGTGKTAAFGLPLVQELCSNCGSVRALILVPTRELAAQVACEISSFRVEQFPRIEMLYGGVSMGRQLKGLKEGAEIVVGTPGRVIDHLERGSLDISQIEYFILDEADEMLNMGFIEDIESIFEKASKEARVLMFSATIPKRILSVASDFMGDYEIVEEEFEQEQVSLTEQFYWVVRENDKTEALIRLIDMTDDFYGLVFCQTKADADSVAKELDDRHYEAAALHGDIPQSQREKILDRFRAKKIRILVATDVAARGIDIEGITHVVNYAIPYDGPTYTHRIGRTGRAGAAGTAVSFIKPNEIRRIAYLKKHTRGSLKEESIPSIAAVLESKRTRILTSTAKKIEQLAAEGTPEQGFIAFAAKLLEYCDAQTALAFMLQLKYGADLSPSHYRSLKPAKCGTAKNFDDTDGVRLFIGIGRKDGITKQGLAVMLSGLLSIPQRLIDRIELKDRFSLATLPKQAANEALRLSKKRSDVPHIHIDAKDKSGFDDFKGSNKKRGRKAETSERGIKRRKGQPKNKAEKYKRR